ncbi:TraB/GumN family protein [Vibrio cholerae]|uniref:TraB/GumN family protein n=1 Tax=Vibrio cholerae TaxID=666 RepID=UPI001882E216|nr:TraB/GumN family protein [Vibrio cholerae]EGR0516306.1 TraB/GumN family protein [Vibrio cholerae]EGR0544859.1 TraB/GumN family protein [Vibrio cholerae]EGR0572867.1 TraB/GumN family protein [Vibrio cholerae]EGR0679320.1 TraB/GumN family protein [Vibrio cholerae]EGR5457898.1 TraB/GumN family protein [Vibrio cholerae]
MPQRLIFSLLLLFSLPLQAEPLFWSATKGSTQLLIFGSLHVGRDDIYPLPKQVEQALTQSAGLVVETDIRKNSSVTPIFSAITSEQVLTNEQLFILDRIAQQLSLDAQQICQMPPWSTSLLIQMRQFLELGYQADRGIDLYFMHQAEQQHIPVLSLETLQFQLDLLAGLPNSGEELLVGLIKDWEINAKLTGCMIQSWKNGDQDKLLEVAKLSEMSPELEHKMLIARNQDWAEKLSQTSFLLEQDKPYLVVVGTLHLVGEQSLLAQLKKKGFSIKQLNQSTEANCSFFE